MADLVVSETDLQGLNAVLMLALKDLEALQQSLRRMDVNVVGAVPLLQEETTFTITRDQDLTGVGGGVAERLDQIERVTVTMKTTDERLGRASVRTR
ncbi:hypothetical protein ACIGXA_26130 [Streptomyces fildesensis]|uniref:Uncharacterized protein n=1 Tax=Streptomyces fildesensis TaxID=375757 RepID=A0ABW8CC31_9ACTN